MAEISICFPAYNEEGNIGSTLKEATEVMEQLKKSYEILVVNDGSTDNTEKVAKEFGGKNKAVKVINHKKNLGYSAATRTCLQKSKGKLIFIIDSDGQQSMKDIPKFVTAMEKGYDIAIGWKKKRYDPFIRVIMSKVYNILFRLLFDSRLHDVDCGFRCLTKDFANKITIKHEGVPVGPELLAQALKMKMRIIEIEVAHRPRLKGKSIFQPYRLPMQIWKILKNMYYLKKEFGGRNEA